MNNAVHSHPPSSQPPSQSTIVGLLRELRDETTTLVQKEVELVKTEMTENIAELATNAIQIGIGAFVAYAGGIILLLGLADLVGMVMIRSGMESDLATWLSRALVGFVVVVVGWILLVRAKKAIGRQNIAPEKTAETMQDNKEWVQEKIQQTT